MEFKIFTDQLSRKVEIPFPPQRIISIVPSQTELLYDLGLKDEVIGITKFCIHPNEWFRTKNRVGGTKKLNIDKIKSLKPDLIIANKEENTKEEVEYLATLFPVWISNVNNLSQAIEMINEVGKIVNQPNAAQSISNRVLSSFKKLNPLKSSLRVAYFIWKNPWMLAGNDTFINALLVEMGFTNVALELNGRYPQVSSNQIRELKPDVIFLSSEPYPFREKHCTELAEFVPRANIKLVDGELFSWYGSRLLKSVDYFEVLMKDLR